MSIDLSIALVSPPLRPFRWEITTVTSPSCYGGGWTESLGKMDRLSPWLRRTSFSEKARAQQHRVLRFFFYALVLGDPPSCAAPRGMVSRKMEPEYQAVADVPPVMLMVLRPFSATMAQPSLTLSSSWNVIRYKF